ncbi:histone acetyltransferase type B catalytic subunit isoform X2 [Neocloeon triangulifer]|uniref:histone acetyltransferase type B catalytic subunit isoform X2 n=1 Tax=Neocloeon triangulifer TaxID=2078957 RepID=UPI00286F6B69|nr:histone acetyltransferase type B catalytic subunit isoform X2 [Neocloeon triangulifer]
MALNMNPYGLASWATDSVEAMNIKLVRTVQDMQDSDLSFKPEMTYQVFGQKEIIAGYKDLKVDLLYGAGSLKTLLNITYSKKVDPDLFEAENVEEKLKDYLPKGYLTSVDNFSIGLKEEEDKFQPPGDKIHEFKVETEDGDQTYEIYHATSQDTKMQAYCERMQTFIMWYIEAASFVDLEDTKWNFFLLFEKYKHDGKPRFAFAGFVSTYEFYCYPDNIRPRVSQMLILPPFQKAGLGVELLTTTFNFYRGKPEVTDVSVESPSPEFQRLRDFVDCLTCMKLPEFSAKNVKKRFSKEMEKIAKQKLKMGKKQAQRVCFILKLKGCNQEDEDEMEGYMDFLKQEADKQNRRVHERAEKKGLLRVMERAKLVEAIPSLSPEYRISSVAQAAKGMFEQFIKVVNRLDRDAED